MRKSLIVGYGNPLRGDDGIGQAVAQALADEAAVDGSEVFSCHQLTPELSERIAAVDLVIFIDAGVGIQPGSVVITPVQSVPLRSSALVHHADPAALLVMARKLYGRSPDGFLVTVGADTFALGESLSGVVAAALPNAVAAVRHLVQRPSNNETP